MKIGDIFKEKFLEIKRKISSPIVVIGPHGISGMAEDEEGAEIAKSIEHGICPVDYHPFEEREFCQICGRSITVMKAAVKGWRK